MKVPNWFNDGYGDYLSLSRLQNEGSQREELVGHRPHKSIKATE